MSEYTPTTDQVRTEYAEAFNDGHDISTWARQFDRWLAAHDRDVRNAERHAIAGAIWADEQECNKAVYQNPTDPFLNGRGVGLQRARDIAEGVLRRATPVEPQSQYEYATTTGPRKAWEDPDQPPEGDGWELDPDRGRPGESWDRFDYHEERYWRRAVEPQQKADEHKIKQVPPWPPYTEATYMLSEWECSCGWNSGTFKDNVQGRSVRDRLLKLAEAHAGGAR